MIKALKILLCKTKEASLQKNAKNQLLNFTRKIFTNKKVEEKKNNITWKI